MLEYAAKGEMYKQLQKKGAFSDKRSSQVGIRHPLLKTCVAEHSFPSTLTR